MPIELSAILPSIDCGEQERALESATPTRARALCLAGFSSLPSRLSSHLGSSRRSSSNEGYTNEGGRSCTARREPRDQSKLSHNTPSTCHGSTAFCHPGPEGVVGSWPRRIQTICFESHRYSGLPSSCFVRKSLVGKVDCECHEQMTATNLGGPPLYQRTDNSLYERHYAGVGPTTMYDINITNSRRAPEKPIQKKVKDVETPLINVTHANSSSPYYAATYTQPCPYLPGQTSAASSSDSSLTSPSLCFPPSSRSAPELSAIHSPPSLLALTVSLSNLSRCWLQRLADPLAQPRAGSSSHRLHPVESPSVALKEAIPRFLAPSFPQAQPQSLCYNFMGLLGQGTYGKVFLGYKYQPISPGDNGRAALRAVKVISKASGSPRQLGRGCVPICGADSLEAETFPREVATLRDVEKYAEGLQVDVESAVLGRADVLHGLAFIHRILEAFQDDENVYIVTEYHPTTLRDPSTAARFRLYQPPSDIFDPARISSSLSLPTHLSAQDLFDSVFPPPADPSALQPYAAALESVRSLSAQLSCALNFLHTHLGIVHHDIKPENILISKDGNAVLADFGAAKKMPQGTMATGKASFGKIVLDMGDLVMLTPVYASPELLERNADGKLVYGSAIDWWAVGVTLFELAVGFIPCLNAPSFNVGALEWDVRGSHSAPRKRRKSDGDGNVAAGFSASLDASFEILNQLSLEQDKHCPRIYRETYFAKFVQELLTADPATRLCSLAEAMAHPFFNSPSGSTVEHAYTWSWDAATRDLRCPPCPDPPIAEISYDWDKIGSGAERVGAERCASTRVFALPEPPDPHLTCQRETEMNTADEKKTDVVRCESTVDMNMDTEEMEWVDDSGIGFGPLDYPFMPPSKVPFDLANGWVQGELDIGVGNEHVATQGPSMLEGHTNIQNDGKGMPTRSRSSSRNRGVYGTPSTNTHIPSIGRNSRPVTPSSPIRRGGQPRNLPSNTGQPPGTPMRSRTQSAALPAGGSPLDEDHLEPLPLPPPPPHLSPAARPPFLQQHFHAFRPPRTSSPLNPNAQAQVIRPGYVDHVREARRSSPMKPHPETLPRRAIRGSSSLSPTKKRPSAPPPSSSPAGVLQPQFNDSGLFIPFEGVGSQQGIVVSPDVYSKLEAGGKVVLDLAMPERGYREAVPGGRGEQERISNARVQHRLPDEVGTRDRQAAGVRRLDSGLGPSPSPGRNTHPFPRHTTHPAIREGEPLVDPLSDDFQFYHSEYYRHLADGLRLPTEEEERARYEYYRREWEQQKRREQEREWRTLKNTGGGGRWTYEEKITLAVLDAMQARDERRVSGFSGVSRVSRVSGYSELSATTTAATTAVTTPTPTLTLTPTRGRGRTRAKSEMVQGAMVADTLKQIKSESKPRSSMCAIVTPKAGSVAASCRTLANDDVDPPAEFSAFLQNRTYHGAAKTAESAGGSLDKNHTRGGKRGKGAGQSKWKRVWNKLVFW